MAVEILQNVKKMKRKLLRKDATKCRFDYLAKWQCSLVITV